MFGHRISWIVGRRNVSSAIGPGEQKDIKNATSTTQPINDPKHYWIEPYDCSKVQKTWREIEEEYACALIVRSSPKAPPERKLINIKSEDIFICRRACLQPSIPLSEVEEEYASIWEVTFSNLKRLIAFATLVGLMYGTHLLNIWGPSGPTLDAILGDPGSKVEQLASVGPVAFTWWNKGIGKVFGLVRSLFPVKEAEKFDEEDFILTLQEEVKEKKEKENEPPYKEDPTEFEEWELVYNYGPIFPKLKVEMSDDTDWLWMEHEDPDFIKATKPNMPYEQSARMLKKLKDQVGVTLASIYSDFCSVWTVNKEAFDDVEIECFEDTELGKICKRKRQRKLNTRINPEECKTCPAPVNEEAVAEAQRQKDKCKKKEE